MKFFVTLLLFMVFGTIMAEAEIVIEKKNDVLTITSDINGIVIAKVVGSTNQIIVDKRYKGNTFVWVVPDEASGAYRYDVRIVPELEKEIMVQERPEKGMNTGDHIGGSVEIINGKFEAQRGEK